MDTQIYHIAVLSNPGNPALNFLPQITNLTFHIYDSNIDQCHFKECSGLVIIPPFDIKTLETIWNEKCHNVKWVHTFSAGVDFISSFITNYLLNNNRILLTNGRGAFSSSLAEYIITSALYFNKQITKLQNNKLNKKWDKFTMSTLKGKTMGFIGYGDIAKSAAKIAKLSFDMKIAVYRKDPSKFTNEVNTSNIVDYIYTDSNDIFATSDFVVCTLPSTSETINFCSINEFELMKSNSVFISCGRYTAINYITFIFEYVMFLYDA
jgi:phosphoglycerate dehydrogenase-like enzyme